ncbi:MAG: ParB/RepB/Spo0J family partition protein [Limnospira sp.]
METANPFLKNYPLSASPNDMNGYHTPDSDGFEVVQQLPLEQIFRSPLQPRAYFSPKKMQEMIASIRQNGIIHAITVRLAATNRYELVAGSVDIRRLKQWDLPEFRQS